MELTNHKAFLKKKHETIIVFLGVLFNEVFLKSRFDCRFLVLPSEATVQWCSSKKVFLKISQYSQGSTCARVSPATLLKRGANSGAFQWILRNF